MTDFIAGRINHEHLGEQLSLIKKHENASLEFSDASKAVFEAGRKLWKYYLAQPNCNVNASLYDIREYFQGRDDKGKMNSKSDDTSYSELIGNLRSALNVLEKKIQPKIYKYGFLKE